MSVDISLADVKEYAKQCFDKAKMAAIRRQIPVKATRTFSEHHAAETISDEPDFCNIEHFDGVRAWAAMLYFDMRKSTSRAVSIGPKDTFITMHVYLPTLLRVIKKSRGTIVGMRGDGAFAMFGSVAIESSEPEAEVGSEKATEASRLACDCGAALITAITDAVNPVLVNGGVRGEIEIGVGIDVGDFVATRIGIERAYELTAYGYCVNNACHRSDHGHNRVVVTNKVRKMFPSSPGGQTKFSDVPSQKDAYFLKFPDSHKPLK